MPDTIYTLYWIRNPNHTDRYSQGYIGITTQKPEDRWKDHRKTQDWWHDDIVCEVLFQVDTEDEVFQLEEHYRPEAYIGLNKKPGGKQASLSHDDETKAKMSANSPFKKPVSAEGVIYESQVAAAAAHGLFKRGLEWRLKSPNWPDWYYLDENGEPDLSRVDYSMKAVGGQPKKVSAEGVTYESRTASAAAHGISKSGALVRINSPNFPDWQWA